MVTLFCQIDFVCSEVFLNKFYELEHCFVFPVTITMNNTVQVYVASPPANAFPIPPPQSSHMESPVQDVEDFSTVCRLCAKSTEHVMPIFHGEGKHVHLAEKIHQHLSIMVTEQDQLPVVACYRCVSTLLAWHDMHEACPRVQSALAARLAAPASAPAPAPSPQKTNVEDMEQMETDTQSSEQRLPNMSEAQIAMLKRIIINCVPALCEKEEDFFLEYACQRCVKSMGSISELADHINSCHPAEATTYADFEQFVKNNITFDEVLSFEDSDSDIKSEITEQPTFSCPFCESMFSSPTRLACHLNTHMEMSIEDGVTCCERSFSSRRALVQHLKERHARVAAGAGAVCRACGHRAPGARALAAHVAAAHRAHTPATTRTTKEHSGKNQKFIPAVCPECNKTFSNKYNMFVHMKSHGGARAQFECDKCNRRYSSRGNMVQHQKTAHGGVLAHVCGACGEAFPTRTARDVHARAHRGLAPFRCRLCARAFRAADSLRRHLDAHRDARPHRCRLCGKAFRRNTHLAYHLRTHRAK